MLSFEQSIPLSLYIHIPWCVRKCPYCDFNSHAVREEIAEVAYIDALLADLEQALPLIWGRSIRSIFIGGGTPSLFSAQSIERLLTGIRSRLTVAPQAEITLEANPGTFEQARFAGFLAAGVNRLSLGVQSLNDDALAALGRIHSSEQARQAFQCARDVGFRRINVDLMFALPKQQQAQALDDLQQVIALQPEHISWYQLTLEPNTAFYHQPPPLPADDACADMQLVGQALLARAGFAQYEVSAYSRANEQSQHNMNYWLFGDYLGIGAGAHSKITDMAAQQVLRITKRPSS